MISSDVGSIPQRIESDVIYSGARKANGLLPYFGVSNHDYIAFQGEVVSAFKDKIDAGIEVPNYPQFRDMNQMFFELMEGIEKHNGALLNTASIKSNGSAIPEVVALQRESRRLSENRGEKAKIKVCVTGPYTLASFFQVKTPGLYLELGEALADIVEKSLFCNRSAKTVHLSIDEPVLGFLNDHQLDYGSEGREALRKSWEKICGVAKAFNLETSIHLHNTSENLFWEAEHLDLIACHVGDPFYTQESTKSWLEETDKRVFASIGVTQYDNLIQSYYLGQGYQGNIPEKIGEVWSDIRKKAVDPYRFLEDPKILRKRLGRVVDSFGVERVGYVSPECGLNSFPDYKVAMECLERHARVVSEFLEEKQ
jgi:5-methyltetrahydropteroyltriglutamate--homocysteine methyltransferase